MSPTPFRMREFAVRLIESDASGPAAGKQHTLAFQTCEGLRPQLVTFMGIAGYRALLCRALALASADVPWLGAIHVKADGSLEGIEELAGQVTAAELFKGRVAMFTHLLNLLVAFIGENLTVRLMADVWPKVRFDDVNPVKGIVNEDKK